MAKTGAPTPDPQEHSQKSPDESTGQAPAPAKPERAEATTQRTHFR